MEFQSELKGNAIMGVIIGFFLGMLYGSTKCTQDCLATDFVYGISGALLIGILFSVIPFIKKYYT